MKLVFLSSIAMKLKLIIILVTFITLSAAISFIIINQKNNLYDDLTNNSLLNSKMISDYCVNPLLFDDADGCNDILQKVNSIPYISSVSIYDSSRKLFSSFSKKDFVNTNNNKFLLTTDTIYNSNNQLHIIKPIVYKNINYGFIYTISTNKLINEKLKNFTILMSFLLILSLLISFLLASYLQRIISKPILKLSNLLNEISSTGDFNKSLKIKRKDEIGALYREFNNLLKEIVTRNNEKEAQAQEIIKLNQELEAKVIQRTSELNNTLKQLEEENKQRKLNEELLKKINFELEKTKIALEDEAIKLIELNKKLTISENELKELNSTKDKFFSIIAHDLKNPIFGVMMLVNLLIDYSNQFDAKTKESHLIKISDAIKTVYNLLENLLSWGRLQSGNLTFILEETNIKYLTIKTFESCMFLAERKNIKLINKIENDIIINADINMIETVLRNLVTNAIKFSYNDSEIIVSANEYSDSVIITIQDFGIGMSQEKANTLFHFGKAKSTIGTANEKGSGLGLIVCNEFILKHNGSIEVESEIGKGSKFVIKLPK